MRLTYTDGRTGLTTTAFRYKLTDDDGTLVKDWTTGAAWTEEPAGTYYLDDGDAVQGTVYAVEPTEGEVGGVGRIPLDKTGYALTAAYDHAQDDVLTPLAAVAAVVAALQNATAGTLINQATRIDANGNIVAAPAGTALGIATAGSTLTLFLATDTTYSTPIRSTTAAADGTWALYATAANYTLVVSLDGHYDGTEGDSVITRSIIVA